MGASGQSLLFLNQHHYNIWKSIHSRMNSYYLLKAMTMPTFLESRYCSTSYEWFYNHRYWKIYDKSNSYIVVKRFFPTTQSHSLTSIKCSLPIVLKAAALFNTQGIMVIEVYDISRVAPLKSIHVLLEMLIASFLKIAVTLPHDKQLDALLY